MSWSWSRLNTVLLFAVLLVLIAMFASRAYGGPLDPPGPVAPTQSNVIYQPASCADFPIVLSAGGSYRLGGNINGCAGKDGIQIAASNVTLDLGGFTVFGVAGSINGISANGPRYPVINNGSVRGWQNGINLVATYGLVDGVRSTNNVANGITIGGGSTVTNCVASLNGADGIAVDFGVVRHCLVAENTSAGIRVGNYSRVEDNRIHVNLFEIVIEGVKNAIRNNDVQSNLPNENIVLSETADDNVLIGNVYCGIVNLDPGPNDFFVLDNVDAC